MNCFHVPRGFSVAPTIALRWSPPPILSFLTLRLPVDLLPSPLYAIIFGHQLGHVSPPWPLVLGLLPVDRFLILSLSRVCLSYFPCTNQSRHFLTNPTMCARVPPTPPRLPDSHLNRSPRLPLVRLWIPVNCESYLLHRTRFLHPSQGTR